MRLPALLSVTALLLVGCAPKPPAGFQGYLEGDFVYIASPLAGRLDTLSVEKGGRVEAGTPLFTLERSAELAAQRQAIEQLRAAESKLEDLKKGSRPSELAALAAHLDQARAAAELSQLELKRQDTLFKTAVISASEFDRARIAHEQNTRVVEELSAQLTTAQLGGRSDVVSAAAADVSAAAAAKERADWNVEQKAQSARKSGLVYDTLYRAGEFVSAGNPVVVLLPPENIKVRFFVPEADFGALKAGQAVTVGLTGRPNALKARISYLSPQPEYTPPVLYNRENRAKLVFLVEAVFDPADSRDLHPGQPVDVTTTP
ncbi:MAG: putative efflux pump rane fusion protein [Verrucomicrobia bacterium]|nr:putative efflux pump rane fusion protein [Verrucomicrobiota bacterium]